MKTTTSVETITPKQAEGILQEHYNRIAEGTFRQRRIYKTVARKYCTDMKAGLWKESPVPIIFDENGNLADGQHRLEAVRQSGTTQDFVVTRGWKAGIIDYIDRGKGRTVGDQLMLHGTKNAAVTAASVTSIVRLCYRGAGIPVSYPSAIHILDTLGMREHIEHIIHHMSINGMKPGGRTVGPIAFYRTARKKKADAFLEDIATLTTQKGSGSHLYAKYLRARSSNSQDAAVQAACACLRIWDNDETAEYFKSTYQACDWMAEQNKKLSAAITDLFGTLGSYGK